MKQLLIPLLVMLSFYAHSQDNGYSYYRYNSAGVPEKVGYSQPNQPPLFSKSAPSLEEGYEKTLELYERIGREKQRQYDENVKSLKDLVNVIWIALNKIEDGDYKTSSIKLMNLYLLDMSQPGIDYSKKEVYNYYWNKIYDFYKNL